MQYAGRSVLSQMGAAALGVAGRRPVATWAVILAFHFSLALPFLPSHQDIPDEGAYTMLAQHLVQDHAYYLDQAAFHQRPGEPNTYYAPAWPFVLAAGYAVVRGPLGFWFVSGAIWCLSFILVWLLGRSLGWRLEARWALALWFSTNPFYLYYHLHLMTETLALALEAAMLVVGFVLVKRPKWQIACLLGLLAGIGHLTRTALLLFPIAFWIATFAANRSRHTIRLALVCLGAYFVVVSPWLVRMYSLDAGFGATELKLGHNLFLYNSPQVDNPYQWRDGEQIVFPPGLEQMTPKQRDSILMRRGIGGILDNPAGYIHNCWRRIGYLFSPVPNFYSASNRTRLAMAAVTVLYFFGLWLMVIYMVVRGVGIRRAEAVLLLTVLLSYIFHILLHASVRQRLPSDLLVAALSISMWQRWRPALSGTDRTEVSETRGKTSCGAGGRA